MKFVRIGAAAENFVLQVYRKKGRLLRAPFFRLFPSPLALPRARLSIFPFFALRVCLFVLPTLFSYADEKAVGFPALL